MEKYKKPPLLFEDQLSQLQSRGLAVARKKRAIGILSSISYYRISAYFYPFLEIPKSNHQFKKGTTFNQCFRLYQFDSELRELTLYAIDQIEIALRTQIIYHVSHERETGGWLSNFDLFESYDRHLNFLVKVSKARNDSKEEFIVHFKKRYLDQIPPAWMSLELVTFRSLSDLYKNLVDKDLKNLISKKFNIKFFVLQSWMQSLVFVRNVCAHHSRLWNRKISIKTMWPKSLKRGWVNNWHMDETNLDANLKVYSMFCIIQFLLNAINPDHIFQKRLTGLLEKYGEIDIKAMGFPKDWEKQDLWLSETQ